MGMNGAGQGGTRRIRVLIAALVCGCLVAIGAAPESGATTPRRAAKPAVHRAKPTPKPKCKTVRRRRGRRWVRVKVCAKPGKRKTTRVSAGGSHPSANTPAPTPVQSLPATGTTAGPTYRGGASGWDEPGLVNPTMVVLSDSARSLKLNQAQDYVVTCPPGRFDVSGKITIWGGHNVVFENCDEYVTNPSGDWAGYLQNQTGTLWVHDVRFGGAHLTGGVQIQEPGATVVMRDVLFDMVYGSYQTNHAECVQTWSGPARFLIDGMECPTTYQGLYLLPNQHDSTTVETAWDFRNVRIDGQGAYDLWLGNVQPSQVGSLPLLNLENVLDCGPGEPRDMDGTSDGGQAWGSVSGCPPGGSGAPVWSRPDGSVTGAEDGLSLRAMAGEEN
jgi:hypothetical protein